MPAGGLLLEGIAAPDRPRERMCESRFFRRRRELACQLACYVWYFNA